MIESNTRLIHCFSAVLPRLSREQILDASIESVPEWDSLATVTLTSVIDQEFETAIDVFDLPELRSFSEVQNYLKRHTLLA